MNDTIEMSDTEFEQQAAAIMAELDRSSEAFAREVGRVKTALNSDFAAADAALVDFYEEVANGRDE